MKAFLEVPGLTLAIAFAVGTFIAVPTYFALRTAKLPRIARDAIVAADFAIGFGLTVYLMPMFMGA